MDLQTRYAYERRIKDLRDEVDKLRNYREATMKIYDGICEIANTNRSIEIAWVLKQIRYCFK